MTGKSHPAVSRRFGIGLVAFAFVASACTPSGGAETQGSDDAVEPDPAELSITPEADAEELPPNSPITITAEGGVITDVQVDQTVSE